MLGQTIGIARAVHVPAREETAIATRVCVVTETYPPEINGVAMTLSRLVDGLRARGHEVSVVRPRQPGGSRAVDLRDPALTLVRGVSMPRYEAVRLVAGRLREVEGEARAVMYIGDFENAVAREAARRGMHGVVCGHIHKAELRAIGPVLYCNTGDWVESCSALAEREDGTLTWLAFAERARAATARRGGSG